MIPTELIPYVLALAGALGAFANAATSKEAPTWSPDTLRQVIIGVFMGALWQTPIANVWPVIEVGKQSLTANIFLVALFTYACADVIGTRLIGALRGLAGGGKGAS